MFCIQETLNELDKLNESGDSMQSVDEVYTEAEIEEIVNQGLKVLLDQNSRIASQNNIDVIDCILYADSGAILKGENKYEIAAEVDLAASEWLEDVSCGDDSVSMSDVRDSNAFDPYHNSDIFDFGNDLEGKTIETEHFKITIAGDPLISVEDYDNEEILESSISEEEGSEGDYSMRNYGYYRTYTCYSAEVLVGYDAVTSLALTVERK